MSAVTDKIANYLANPANAADAAETKMAFLYALAERGIVIDACRRAGIHRNTAYIWRNQDPEFRKAWDIALEEATDIVEGSLYDNALKGNVVAQIFYLKNNRSKYRDKLPVDLTTAQREIENRILELTGQTVSELAASPAPTNTKDLIADVIGIPRKPARD